MRCRPCSDAGDVLLAAKGRKGPGMMGAPDQFADEAKLHAGDLQHMRPGAQRTKTKKLARIRSVMRRVLRRQNPPASR